MKSISAKAWSVRMGEFIDATGITLLIRMTTLYWIHASAWMDFLANFAKLIPAKTTVKTEEFAGAIMTRVNIANVPSRSPVSVVKLTRILVQTIPVKTGAHVNMKK